MSTIRVITARVNETRSRLMASVGSPNDEILDDELSPNLGDGRGQAAAA